MILDGIKTEEMLLANLVGIRAEDFRRLLDLGLIEPAGGQSAGVPDTSGSSVDKQFAGVLAQVIKIHLGLAGFSLLNAVEKADTTSRLHELAQRAIVLIEQKAA